MNQMSVQRDTSLVAVLMDWKPVQKGQQVGYAKILLGRSLIIHDVPVMLTRGKAWAAMPSKPVVINGQQVLDAEGKRRYAPVMEWAGEASRNRFSDAVVSAVLDAYPTAFTYGDTL